MRFTPPRRARRRIAGFVIPCVSVSRMLLCEQVYRCTYTALALQRSPGCYHAAPCGDASRRPFRDLFLLHITHAFVRPSMCSETERATWVHNASTTNSRDERAIQAQHDSEQHANTQLSLTHSNTHTVFLTPLPRPDIVFGFDFANRRGDEKQVGAVVNRDSLRCCEYNSSNHAHFNVAMMSFDAHSCGKWDDTIDVRSAH